MNEIFFTADLHFQHKFMADLRGVGREHLDEHDEMLCDNWKALVGRKDTVYFLGDFSFGGLEQTRKIFESLPGNKHLIAGNHDPNRIKRFGWASVHDLHKVSADGQKYVLCHYPLLTWPNAHHGVWHLHGHTHNNLRAPVSTRLDVGVDCSESHGLKPFSPFSIDDVHRILSVRQYDYVDHHDGGEMLRNVIPQVIPGANRQPPSQQARDHP